MGNNFLDGWCVLWHGELATVWCVFLVLINFSFSLAWYNESSPVFFQKKTHNSSSQRLQTSPYNILRQIALMISSHPVYLSRFYLLCSLPYHLWKSLCFAKNIHSHKHPSTSQQSATWRSSTKVLFCPPPLLNPFYFLTLSLMSTYPEALCLLEHWHLFCQIEDTDNIRQRDQL